MSDQELPRCPYTGKVSYPNPQKAWAAARRINRKRGRRLGPGGQRLHITPHPCDQCHQWHVTTQDKTERKARGKE